MQLYIVRHGIAIDREDPKAPPDPDRFLTEEGIERTKQVAKGIVALGATVEADGPTVIVRGGRSRLHAPDGPIDLGNSGTGMRLLAGVAATLPGATTLTGDDSLRTRPMDRVAEPLGLMGARVSGEGERCLPPIRIDGGALATLQGELVRIN